MTEIAPLIQIAAFHGSYSRGKKQDFSNLFENSTIRQTFWKWFQKCIRYVLGSHLKNVWSASPNFSGPKNQQNLGWRIGKSQFYSFWKFQNYIIEKNCNKHLPPLQRIIHQCIINLHLFLSIGIGIGWINYLVRQNCNFMFSLVCQSLF